MNKDFLSSQVQSMLLPARTEQRLCTFLALQLDLKRRCCNCTSISFLATANSVKYCGADVLFADVCPETGLMTSETYKDAFDVANSGGLKVRAVLPVHLTGTPVDLEEIHELSKK